MNYLIFTKLDSSADDADIIQRKEKTKQKQNEEDFKGLHL